MSSEGPGSGNADKTRDQSGVRYQLFVVATDLMKNEAQLVWSRYSAMLTANSVLAIIPGAIFSRSDRSPTDLIVILLSSLFGIVLSIVWYRLTKIGWDLSLYWLKEAQDYKPPHDLRNPLVVYNEWRKGGTDNIRRWAMAVIVLFIVGYAAAALSTVCTLACQNQCVLL